MLELGMFLIENNSMKFGITKTIPAKAGVETLESLYDGSRKEYEFHMAGKTPTRLKVGDYVYTIFGDQLHGRLKIREFITGAVNPNSGKPRILIVVEAPGERLATPVPKQGHRGTRYTEGEDWPV
jgi:hypothetical protein